MVDICPICKKDADVSHDRKSQRTTVKCIDCYNKYVPSHDELYFVSPQPFEIDSSFAEDLIGRELGQDVIYRLRGLMRQQDCLMRDDL